MRLSHKPRLVTCVSDWPAIDQVPTNPSSDLIYLLEWLTELRQPVYSADHQLIIEGMTQEQPDGREAQGKVCGRGKGLPCPLSPPLPARPHVPQT